MKAAFPRSHAYVPWKDVLYNRPIRYAIRVRIIKGLYP